jgi:hypothetical protein
MEPASGQLFPALPAEISTQLRAKLKDLRLNVDG